MQKMILELSALSVLCGVLMSLIPEGGCKKIAGILCTAALLICIIKPLKGFDFEAYATNSAKVAVIEETFLTNTQMLEDKFNRFIVGEEYAGYILEKASSQNINNIDVSIETSWHFDGIWIPYSVSISGECDEIQKRKLIKIIEAGLGIPQERQYWQDESN